MSRGFVLRNPATCCASVETGSVSTASNTTCPATPASYTRLLHLPATTIPASPASTISSYNRFLAFSMTAPPPEKSISGGYRPAGLRRAPESARLPAGCCLCEQYSLGRSPVLSEGRGYEDSVPSRHKKSSLSGCYFVRAQERSDRRGYRGKHSPCPGAVRRTGDTKTLSLRGTKKAAYPAAIFVRAKGLEPIRTKAPDPKSGLATNYNTLAKPFGRLITGARHRKKPLEAVSTCIRKECKCKNNLSFLQICKL